MNALLLLLTGVAIIPSIAWGAQDRRAGLLDADRAASKASSDSGTSLMLAARLDSAGVLLWPGAPVVIGSAEVKRLLTSGASRDSTRLTWQPLGITLAHDSAVGMTWGIAATTPRLVPGPPQFGRYMIAWRRRGDHWLMDAVLFSGIVPPMSTVPADLPRTRSPAIDTGAAGPFVAADLAFARLAASRGAAKAFRHWAAPDATIFGERGLLTRGPDAIARGVAGPDLWRWHPVAAGASSAGDLGWTVGEAVIAPQTGDPIYSKYLTIWIRNATGLPRFITDGGNLRPDGAATKPKPQSPDSVPKPQH
ncbi:MAG TPA: hypothetical protein VFH40_13220 [Gemmatimonadales bacterium]|nr:hypothetical protein [Gemmatimonadales bacterium]